MIRPASTLCLLRSGPEGLEVVMVRRSGRAAFVGGAFVFPGGVVDEIDRSELARRVVVGVEDDEMFPWVAAAVREAAEEAGVLVSDSTVSDFEGLRGADLYQALGARSVSLDGGRLAHLWTWVTPAGQPRRFDTRFFLAAVEISTVLRPDGREVTEAVWVTPARALERAGSGEWFVIPPTLETLRLLDRFDDPSRAVAFAAGQKLVPRVEPRIVLGAVPAILLPGDPGYDGAGSG